MLIAQSRTQSEELQLLRLVAHITHVLAPPQDQSPSDPLLSLFFPLCSRQSSAVLTPVLGVGARVAEEAN